MDPEGPWTRVRVTRDPWSTPRALGPGPTSRRTAGRHCVPSDPGRNRPEELVDTAGPRTRTESPERCGRHPGPSGTGRIARYRWSTPGSGGNEPESPGDCWSTPQAVGPGPESPGTAGQHRGPSGTGPSRPGHPVDPAGHQAWARISRDSWSTVAVRPERESPGRVGPHRGPKGMGRCRPGQLVNPECLGTRAPFTRDSWLTPRALGHKRECPGTAGRPLGTRRRAGVARDSLSTPQALGPKCEWPGSAG